MNKIQDLPCRKCGGNTSIRWIPNITIADFKKGGLKRICSRCGFEEFINDLEKESFSLSKKLEKI